MLAGGGRGAGGLGYLNFAIPKFAMCLVLSPGHYLMDISGQADILIILYRVSFQSRTHQMPYNIALNDGYMLQYTITSFICCTYLAFDEPRALEVTGNYLALLFHVHIYPSACLFAVPVCLLLGLENLNRLIIRADSEALPQSSHK